MCDGIFFAVTKKFFLNGKIFFWKPLESLTCIPYHKNLFYKWFCKKFPGFSKISNSLGFNQSNLFFDWSKRKRKNPVLNSWVVSNPFSIPLNRSKIVFLKQIRIKSQFFRALSSSSLISLSIPSHYFFFFFLSFSKSKSQRFSSSTPSKNLFPLHFV